MRRLVSLALALALTPTLVPAQTVTEFDWQLLALDGRVVAADTVATMQIGTDGTMRGKAPCNSYGSKNQATLPALSLGGIRATRMTCDKLAEEQAFFDALSLMTDIQPDGDQNLILTGPDGRSMEFVTDRTDSQITCKTCPPTE